LAASTAKATVFSEAQYARAWCQERQGRIIRLTGTPLPICEFGQYRVAAAFATNWAATIGSAYFATIDSDKKPGAALILQNKGDRQYYNLLNRVIGKQHLPLRTWIIQP
jgi:hypothetical protein